MAKFKCISSGNIFEFKSEHDISSMRTHSEYEEVKEVPKEEIAIPTFTTQKSKTKDKK
jgi:hypothetical protein